MNRSTKTLFACAALLGLTVAGGLSMANATPDTKAPAAQADTVKPGKHGERARDGHRPRHEFRNGDRDQRRHGGDRNERRYSEMDGRHQGKGFHGHHGGPGMGFGPGPHGGPHGSPHHGPRHGGFHGPRPDGFIAGLFERYDVDDTGKIKIEDILTLRTEEVKKYDKNGDGQLDLKEYEALWLDQMREMMVRSFQRFDRDGDAQVTPQEYNRQIERLAKRLDRNKDGTIEKLDRRGDRPGREWRRDGGRGMERGPADQQPPADDDAGSDTDAD